MNQGERLRSCTICLRNGDVIRVRDDWNMLQATMKLSGDAAYLHHKGRPVVAVWGIGFSDDRKCSLSECFALVKWLKSEGCTVMVGVPSFWRDGLRDSVDDPLLHEILKQADIISPWTIGRYRTPEEAQRLATQICQPDRLWCEQPTSIFFPSYFRVLVGTTSKVTNWMPFHDSKDNSCGHK